ncbi:MAG TPA: AAA family ATPase [Candidatus Saccharimonadales bacterium]|nr:AAA family ATPase [Candidatus Saccharimonadales bacterium]
MPKLCLSSKTQEDIRHLIKLAPHAIMLIGPNGIGKKSLGKYLAESVLDITDLDNYPYSLNIEPDGKSISIELVRQMEHFLALKVPIDRSPNRVLVIQEAEKLTLEAQNALLKTLEEPPASTVIIMLVASQSSVLPTIRSRTQKLHITLPSESSLRQYFSNGDDVTFNQAYLISGGLPGLMHALLENENHPLIKATEDARTILSKNLYERNLMINSLSKDSAKLLNIFQILIQMAEVSIKRGSNADKWQSILEASYEARRAVLANSQPKLVLMKLMLSL